MNLVDEIIAKTRELEAVNTEVMHEQAAAMKAMLPFIEDLDIFEGGVDEHALEEAVNEYFAANGDQAVEIAKLQVSAERKKTQLELKLEPLYDKLMEADDATWSAFAKQRLIDTLSSLGGMTGLFDSVTDPG